MTDYVKFFRDTSPYINRHRGKTFVIVLRGEAVEDRHFANIVHDVALLHSLGIRIVLVHGARPQIDSKLTQCNLIPRYDAGIRITDADTMICVQEAVGSTRIAIESMLSMGLPNSPMQDAAVRVVGGNFITAKPLGIRHGVDFHHTGEVRKLDRAGITRQLELGAVVLLSPLGYSPTGEVFNLSCEDVATETAIALEAEKLILFCSEPGISDADGVLVKSIDMAEVRKWLELVSGQAPLRSALQSAYDACLNGVERSHLISYREDGALLRELFTRDGAGTLVSQQGSETIRQATIDDVGAILELIAPLEASGALVKRSRELLETEISRFQVVVHPDGMIIACAALYPFKDAEAGELACVATHPDFQHRGLGKKLLNKIEQRAKSELKLDRLFVLTTQAAQWFQEQGFAVTTLDQLPQEKAALYNLQRNSKILSKAL